MVNDEYYNNVIIVNVLNYFIVRLHVYELSILFSSLLPKNECGYNVPEH